MAEFAFVVHPTSLADVLRYEPGVAGKGRAIVGKILEWMPAYAAARVTGVRAPDGRETSGWLVAANYLPERMLELPRETVYAKVLDAVRIGAELGARIVGLGAFSGVVGDAGATIAARSPIAVTTGNSLTIATGVRSLLRAAAATGVRTAEATAVVLGATGSIGSASVALLAPHVAHVVLVARNRTRLERLQASLAPTLPCTTSIATDVREAVPRGDLVLTATTSTRELIEPGDLRPGAIVCELSLPHDVGARVGRARPDVLVLEGGNLRVPGALEMRRVREPERAFDFGLPPGTALACLCETMTLALCDRTTEHYTLGRGIDLAKVREIDALAEEAGFALAAPRAFDRTLGPDDYARVAAATRRALTA